MIKNAQIKYILYARKSSESEDRQVASIESQVGVLKDLAQKEGLEILEILTESQSAKEPGRPIFNKMIEKISTGEAQGIICWKLDRLARNPLNGGTISWMLQKGIIKHIQTYERSYYPTDNVLMMSVEFGMANQFIRDLSENTKRGLRTKAKNGWYPDHAPLGYTHNPLKKKGEKEIIKDPERFDLVRKMWDLMLTGNYTPQQIWKIANQEWKLKNEHNQLISRSNVYLMFRNPFYYGKFEYPKNSGNWYEGQHEPMIAKEEFIRVQNILNKPIIRSNFKQHYFPFRGLIRCGECGAVITAEEKIKKQKNGNIHRYIYYHCTKRKNPNCSQKCIEYKELLQRIEGILSQIEIPATFHEWALKELEKETKQESEDRNKILNDLQNSYQQCLNEIDGVIGMRARRELDEEDYKRKMSELSEKKNKLYELIQDTNRRVESQIENATKLLDFAKNVMSAFKNGGPETKQQILMNLGSNLYLKDKKLSIELAKPFVYMKEISAEVKQINENVRTSKNIENKRTLSDLYSQSPILLRGQDSDLQPTGYT